MTGDLVWGEGGWCRLMSASKVLGECGAGMAHHNHQQPQRKTGDADHGGDGDGGGSGDDEMEDV